MIQRHNREPVFEWYYIMPAALLVILLHALAISRGFGYFRDEFYYIACSNHPAFGYVDQPPLSLWILKCTRFLFGDSVIAIRILPMLGSGLFVFMTGLIARELGGNRIAMILASFSAFAVLGNLFVFTVYSMNFIDLLVWQALFLILIRLIKSGEPKYWIHFGVVCGLGLLNKTSVLFFVFGLFVGLLLTETRKQFKLKELWIGSGIAGVIFLPYIIWNFLNHWPMLEFMHNAQAYKMAKVSPLAFFTGQVLYNNPLNLLIWIPGLLFFLFSRSARPYRLFGWMFLSLYILFTIQSAKDYYLAAAYPVLFAGGAVAWEKWLKPRIAVIFTGVFLVFLISETLYLSPLALPILPVEKTIAHIQKLGIQGNPGENHEMGVLPQHFADMTGWDDMLKLFGDVYQSLSPAEQAECLIYVRNYGEAGAIDLLGRQYGLPAATCAHNNYWIWGPQDWNGEIAIIYGWSHDVQENFDDLNRRFESVELAATFTHPNCMPYQSNRHIFICRRANFTFKEIWDGEKNFI
jgi:hypothetical protein